MSLLVLLADAEAAPVGDQTVIAGRLDAYQRKILESGPAGFWRLNDIPPIPTGAQLRWRPPDFVGLPTTKIIPQAGNHTETLGENEDATIIMPSGVRTGTLTIVNGGNVRVIGGAVTLASGLTSSSTAAITFQDVKGSVYLEGLSIDTNGQGFDAIAAGGSDGSPPYTKFPDIYLQNSRITVNRGGSSYQAAILRPQYPVSRIYIDNLTGFTNFYGLLLQQTKPISGAYLSRINLEPISTSQPILLYILESSASNPGGLLALTPYPIYFNDVFLKLWTGNSGFAGEAAPVAGATADGVDVGLRLNPDGSAFWGGPLQSYGDITPGSHADYVGASIPGPGYVSPGYVSTRLASVVGPIGDYDPSSYHIFNIKGGAYETPGAHQFGLQRGIQQNLRLQNNLHGIASKEVVSVGATMQMGPPKILPQAIGPPVNQVEQPDVQLEIPAGTALAMPRGPTGSVWGFDATPVSGRPSILPRQQSHAVGNQFAQAADFYDSVAISHHPEYLTFAAGGRAAQENLAISRIQELGIRHVRLGLFSPANHGGQADIQTGSQGFGAAIKAFNTARNPATTQPIIGNYGAMQPPANEAQRDSAVPSITNTGGTFLRPLDGPAGTVAKSFYTSGPWVGEIYENAGTYWHNGWSIVGSLQPTNEPYAVSGLVWNGLGSLREMCRQMKDAKNARTNQTVLAGADYVSSATGRIEPGPAKAPQIPVVGFDNTPAGSQAAGDYTDRADLDYGSWHPYMYHEIDVVPEFVGYDWTPDGSKWNSNPGYVDRNGALSPQGLLNRTIPMVTTETGFILNPAHSTFMVPNGNDGGPRFTPAEVAGVYLNQTLIQWYCCMAKRTTLFSLHDISSGSHGICAGDWTRRECFYAVKNLMRHVGWTQSSSPATGNPISVPLVGTFTPGARNFDPLRPSTYTEDALWKLILQRSDTEYLVILARNRSIWGRNSQAYQTVSDPRDITLQLPSGTWAVSVAEPEKVTVTALNDNGQTTVDGRPIRNPNDGLNYPNPGDGMAYSTTGIAGVDQLTPNVSNQIRVRMAALTRVIKIVKQVPILNVPTTSMTFAANQGGTSPAPQTASITNTGAGTMNFTASSNLSWIAVSPTSGTGPATLTVTPNTTSLAAGTYVGAVTITAAGAAGSPKTINITVSIASSGLTGTSLDNPEWIPYG